VSDAVPTAAAPLDARERCKIILQERKSSVQGHRLDRSEEALSETLNGGDAALKCIRSVLVSAAVAIGSSAGSRPDGPKIVFL
jgi:hypothetical protein